MACGYKAFIDKFKGQNDHNEGSNNMDAFAATATFRAEASQFSGLAYRLQRDVIDLLEKFKKAIENDLTVLKSKATAQSLLLR